MGQVWVSTGISGEGYELLWQPVMTKVNKALKVYNVIYTLGCSKSLQSWGEVVEELLGQGQNVACKKER